MIIGIDARPVVRPAHHNRGIGLYTKHLCTALIARNNALGRPHELTFAVEEAQLRKRELFGAAAGGDLKARALPAIRKPSRLQWMIDRWALPKFVRSTGVHVFHATDLTSIPLVSGVNVIAHVYDMIPFVFWEEFSKRNPADFCWALRLAKKRIQKADLIITLSQHSKNDIVARIGYPESRIHVIYGGPTGIGQIGNQQSYTSSEKPLRMSTASGELIHNQPSDFPYFIYVGGADFRKNLPFLIRAFGAFSERRKDVRLLLVGGTFEQRHLPEVREIFSEIIRLNLNQRVLITGFVDENSLQLLYRGAVALVLPSLYEGFGLPVLEAMTLNTPVVASKTSSIPEVLGDTGLLFDPRDKETLVDAFELIYNNASLRAELSMRAYERSKLFSWDNAAGEIFKIYSTME